MKDKKKYGDFVQLTDDEYAKLVEKFGEQSAREKIENMNDAIAIHGYKYKSHYKAVLVWSKPKKTKLWPITGRVCGITTCPLPAVYKSKGSFDHYYCNQHMPEKVKEYYE